MNIRIERRRFTFYKFWVASPYLGLVYAFEQQGLAERRRNWMRWWPQSGKRQMSLCSRLTTATVTSCIAASHRAACIINHAMPHAFSRRHLIYANRIAGCAGAWREGHSGTRQVAREVAMDAAVSTWRHQFLLLLGLRQKLVRPWFSFYCGAWEIIVEPYKSFIIIGWV